MFEIDDIADVVAEAVREATAPLAKRIAELEARPVVKAMQGERGEKGDPGEVDMDAVKALVDEAVAAIEMPEPIPGPAGPQGEKGERGEPGPQGETGRDGRDGAAGRDGEKGMDGKDGRDGIDGKDGESLTLDDFDVTQVDERCLEFGFTKGDTTYSFEIEFPVAIYRGVYENEREYAKGDMVTWAGSLWHANEATASKPGSDGPWQLAAKKGRDGRDAK